MKALVLAGGAGTRLRPITYTSSKQLVPVANKPILFYALEQLAEADIREVGMIVGDTADEIKAAVGDGSKWGLDVTFIPQEAPLGLAHTVLIAREFLGDDDFVMYLGDNLIRQGIKEFVDKFRVERVSDNPPSAHILLAKVPDPQRFGCPELDANGRVLRLIEKPKVPPSEYALVGFYMFSNMVHEAVAALKPSARGELEITEAIQWLIDGKRDVRSEFVEGYWKDLGELDAFLEGNRLLLEMLDRRIDGYVDKDSKVDGRVVIEKGAEVVGTTIRGPAIIGRDAKLVNSYVGPFTAIGDSCELVESEVEHSVIMEGSKLLNIGRLEDSLIGREAQLVRTQQRPRATRVMIGDHSWMNFSWQ